MGRTPKAARVCVPALACVSKRALVLCVGYRLDSLISADTPEGVDPRDPLGSETHGLFISCEATPTIIRKQPKKKAPKLPIAAPQQQQAGVPSPKGRNIIGVIDGFIFLTLINEFYETKPFHNFHIFKTIFNSKNFSIHIYSWISLLDISPPHAVSLSWLESTSLR